MYRTVGATRYPRPYRPPCQTLYNIGGGGNTVQPLSSVIWPDCLKQLSFGVRPADGRRVGGVSESDSDSTDTAVSGYRNQSQKRQLSVVPGKPATLRKREAGRISSPKKTRFGLEEVGYTTPEKRLVEKNLRRIHIHIQQLLCLIYLFTYLYMYIFHVLPYFIIYFVISLSFHVAYYIFVHAVTPNIIIFTRYILSHLVVHHLALYLV